MSRAATYQDIDSILDRLARLPKLGAPLQRDAGLRDRLRLRARLSAERFATPRSEIEMLLRAELRERL